MINNKKVFLIYIICFFLFLTLILFPNYNSKTQLFTYFVITLISAFSFYTARKKILPHYKSQRYVEKIVNRFIQICSVLAILITLGIFLSLVFETLNFFSYVNPFDFLFGIKLNA